VFTFNVLKTLQQAAVPQGGIRP